MFLKVAEIDDTSINAVYTYSLIINYL